MVIVSIKMTHPSSITTLSFQVTTAEKRTYSIGLTEVGAGDAATLMEAFGSPHCICHENSTLFLTEEEVHLYLLAQQFDVL
jgi:hypothetical protein